MPRMAKPNWEILVRGRKAEQARLRALYAEKLVRNLAKLCPVCYWLQHDGACQKMLLPVTSHGEDCPYLQIRKVDE